MIFDSSGVVIDTYDELLSDVQTDYLGQWPGIKTKLSSSAGQMQRLMTKRELEMQEKILQVYTQLDARLAEGVHADRNNAQTGSTRLPNTPAEVRGTATGTPATSIPNGTTVEIGGFQFVTSGGPHVIGGGGTISDVLVVASLPGEVDVATLGAWTIIDTVSGFASFDDDTQPVVGRLVETDLEYRARAEVERFSRSSGPLLSIESAVSKVKGVTYVKAWHNVTVDPVDADGIELHGLKVVVEGGDAAQVAQAIWSSMPGGHLLFASDESEVIVEGPAIHTIVFDRVDDIDMWVKVTLTTSTSEEAAPDGLEDLVKGLVYDYAILNWDIGSDVLAHRVSGALSSLAGVDATVIEFSTDDGGGDPYSSAKKAMSIIQRAVPAKIRITLVEN